MYKSAVYKLLLQALTKLLKFVILTKSFNPANPPASSVSASSLSAVSFVTFSSLQPAVLVQCVPVQLFHPSNMQRHQPAAPPSSRPALFQTEAPPSSRQALFKPAAPLLSRPTFFQPAA